MAGNVGFLKSSSAAVTFTDETLSGSSTESLQFANSLGIALWGEDNQFPQHVVKSMEGYGLGKAALNWKAKMYYGSGVVAGTVDGYDEKGNEKFTPLDRTKHPEVFEFIEAAWFHRFMMEYPQDLAWFWNAFPELILNNAGDKIVKFVHQESCDCRLEQHDKFGRSNKVYLSKFWGASDDQIAKFNPTKKVQGLQAKSANPNSLDKSLVKAVDCIDMYNPLPSLKRIADAKKGKKGLKSAILPVNFSSPGKTYYQVTDWDGARLAGWIKIANKIPALVQLMYQKAFKIKYHIEVPVSHFHEKFGQLIWEEMAPEAKEAARYEVLEQMDGFLTQEDGGFDSFVSFFGVNMASFEDFGRTKIEEIKQSSNLDKELVTGSAADQQFLISANINPTIFGAATIGNAQRSGGSDIRESFLVYLASLHLERQIMLSPLYLVRDFNNWDPNIVFRIRDTVLTTLDTGAGTTKKLS